MAINYEHELARLEAEIASAHRRVRLWFGVAMLSFAGNLAVTFFG